MIEVVEKVEGMRGRRRGPTVSRMDACVKEALEWGRPDGALPYGVDPG